MRTLSFFSTLVCFWSLTCTTQAAYEEVGYDSLLSELTQATQTTRASQSESISLKEVKFHFQFGYISSFNKVEVKDDQYALYPSGVEVSLGIDLLSRYLKSWVSLRNFDESRFEPGLISAKEIDFKVTWQNRTDREVHCFFGGGLSTRYTDFTDNSRGQTYEYTSPQSLFLAGVNIPMSEYFSFGGELARRNPLGSDTIDRGVWDSTIRLNAHF